MDNYITEMVKLMKYTIEKYGLLLTWLSVATLILFYKLDAILLAVAAVVA